MRSGDRFVAALFFSFLAAIVVAYGAYGCSDGTQAATVLRKAGYRDIRTGGWRPMFCGRDDMRCTEFWATSPSGERVEGAVGCGLLKGCTVRL